MIGQADWSGLSGQADWSDENEDQMKIKRRSNEDQMNLSSVLSSFMHLSNIIEHLLESYLEDLLTLAKIKRRSNEDQMKIK